MGIAESLKAYLGENPLNQTLHVEEATEDILLKRYVSGDAIRRRTFTLTGLSSMDELQVWIEEQNRRRNLPKLSDGSVARKLECQATEGQVQVKLTYYQTGGKTK
ncbi:MAG: hypothetical protein FWD84_03885 [Oscillospiraceae bacterium]|nr:hypothetical protein [Oscillospiraceae bacterium]